MSSKQYQPILKDEAEAYTSLIRFLTTGTQAHRFEKACNKEGKKVSEVLRELAEQYIDSVK